MIWKRCGKGWEERERADTRKREGYGEVGDEKSDEKKFDPR